MSRMDILGEPGWGPAVRLPLADAARLAGVEPQIIAQHLHEGRLSRGDDKRLTIDVAELRLIYPELPRVPGEQRPRPQAMQRPDAPRRRRAAPAPRQKVSGWLALGLLMALIIAGAPFLRQYLDPDVESFLPAKTYRVQLDPDVRQAIVRRGPGVAWDPVAVLPSGAAVVAWGRSRDDDRWLAVRTRRGLEGYLPESQLRPVPTQR
jgi:hypothetical protein